MLALLAPASPPDAGWWLQALTDNAEPCGAARRVRDVAELVELEAARPRWIWSSTSLEYPALLNAGLRVERCADITLTERILLAREGRYGRPSSAAAVHARLHGLDVPADPDAGLGPTAAEPSLFDSEPVPVPDSGPLTVLREAWLDQQQRIADNKALKLLVAAESASALAAAEMGFLGLPLREEVHRKQLVDVLGPEPSPGLRPAALEALAARITAAFGYPVNPDSPADLREAFRRAGFNLQTTRRGVIQRVDHPAVPAVLEYKELARLYSANGWNWLAEWVRNGRFHAEYLPGGVVSGRWAARGGGGLQIPRMVRRAVIADPGYQLVVADAAQLEPRVLAAVSGDPALQAVSGEDDLYTALAADGFGGDRAHAKVAMLGAMYGATSGESGRLLPILRERYPIAMACVEAAAHRGERGDLVQSVLGRTSPPPSPEWWSTVQAGSMPDASAAAERRARETAKAWGRFTRNFIIQGSAADWASVWLSTVRRGLTAVPAAELVFFQHDELLVHVPVDDADQVSAIVVDAAEVARRLVFPGSSAATPVRPVVVDCYADAK